MKIGTKISLGFGSITAVTALLGIIAFVMFQRVDSRVADLTERATPIVTNSTGVERAAFECILAVKNYVAKPDEEIHKLAQRKVGDLTNYLAAIDVIAAATTNKSLTDRAATVRKIALEWADLYEQGVAPDPKHQNRNGPND